jgi:hypothetical protein
MKTITRTSTATTEKGNQMTLTVTASKGYEEVTEKVWIDEYVERTTKKEINETNISIEVKGQVFCGDFRILTSDEMKKYNNQLYASFAGKLGISEIIFNQFQKVIAEAKAEAETDENWIEYQKLRAKANKEEEEYYNHVKAVENMMTLNGRTY